MEKEGLPLKKSTPFSTRPRSQAWGGEQEVSP